MNQNNSFKPVSGIRGQGQAYIYNILHDMNKFKILLVFMNKGFTWHRELKSFGIYNNIIEETLNEFNNLGFIELKELHELDDVQYESIKTVKQDIQPYFKIYFTNERIFDIIKNYEEDINYLIERNSQLIEFVNMIKFKLKPFLIKTQQILEEEKTQYIRNVTLNGITFQKDTILSKEVKKILSLSCDNKGRDLIINKIKPVALMTRRDRKKYLNKVNYNNKDSNPSIFRDIETYDYNTSKEINNSKDLLKINKNQFVVLDEEKFKEFLNTNEQLKNKKIGEVFLDKRNDEECLDFLDKL